MAIGNMILSFRTAIYLDEETVQLTGLLPGRFGTDWMQGQNFPSGTKLAQITDEDGNASGLEFIPLNSSFSGQEKAIEIYASQEPMKSTGNFNFRARGYSLTPLRPYINIGYEDDFYTFHIWPRSRHFESSADAIPTGRPVIETDGRTLLLQFFGEESGILHSETITYTDQPVEKIFSYDQINDFFASLEPGEIRRGRVIHKGYYDGFPRYFSIT